MQKRLSKTAFFAFTDGDIQIKLNGMFMKINDLYFGGYEL